MTGPIGFLGSADVGWGWADSTPIEPPPVREEKKMPIPEPVVTAIAWTVAADVLLVSAFLAAYAARIARRWMRGDR